MVVRKIRVDVARDVICKWSVVCGERGRGMESCFGWSVGNAEDIAAAVVSGGGCAWGGASEDADITRGISDVRSYMLQSTYCKSVSVLFLRSVSLTAFSPMFLSGKGRS